LSCEADFKEVWDVDFFILGGGSQLGGAELVNACSRGLLTADGGLSLLTNLGLTICLLAMIF